MRSKPSDGTIAVSLLLAVFLWGANNTGIKFMVKFWPPLALGSTRFLLAGLVLMALLRWTPLFGQLAPLSRELKLRLWWRTGLSLALYIVAFNWALKKTAVSHVALYLGAAPVWALLWEGRPARDWKSAQRYGAAALAFAGVLFLVWPSLRRSNNQILGEILGLTASVLWTNFGRQCHAVGRELTGAEITAHTFWRAAVLVAPFAVVEVSMVKIPWRADLIGIQLFSVLGGSVLAFGLWSNALRHWKTSQVYLFNNLVPLTTMAWANVCLGEPITRSFWLAMLLIAAGVLLGQANWQRFFGARWMPSD